MQPDQATRLLAFFYEADQAAEPLCHANQLELADYIDAEQNGRPIATLYPDLHAQLATCAICRQAYEELKMLVSMEQQDALVEPPNPAAFDFGYLPRLPKPRMEGRVAPLVDLVVGGVRWRLTHLRRMVVNLSKEFVQSLQPVGAQPAFLKAAPRDLFAISSPNLAEDLAVTITAREKRGGPERCTLSVRVEIPSRGGWPHLAGTSVTLAVGGQAIETRYTDAMGETFFDNIARQDLPHLTLAVEVREAEE